MNINIREEYVQLFDGHENITIMQISDVHLWFSKKILEDLKEIISHKKPNLIVLTGDYYDLPKGARNFRQFLLDISPNNKVYFIQGNHDVLWGSKVSNLLLNIENINYVENFVFRHRSNKGNILTITAWGNKQKLVQEKNIRNIVLIHNPEDIEEKELKNIDLIFAGHLHGCQFIFYKSKNSTYFPGNIYYKNCTDRKIIGNNTMLIVSKGLGDTLPLRWNSSKEVVWVVVT